MKTSRIVQCKCVSEFQDKRYGEQQRVATVATKTYRKESGTADVKCTVCGKTHSNAKV